LPLDRSWGGLGRSGGARTRHPPRTAATCGRTRATSGVRAFGEGSMSKPSVLRWLGLERACDRLFALADASARAARRAPASGPPPGKARRPPTRREVHPQLEPLETRWVMNTVAFSNSSFSVTESAGSATITVTLDVLPSSTTSVQYTTTGGTATS